MGLEGEGNKSESDMPTFRRITDIWGEGADRPYSKLARRGGKS